MAWEVQFHEAFEPEFDGLPEAVQDELLAHARLLEEFGPALGRPHVDTLKGSRHKNLKELRFEADNGVWRVAFAFDPKRKAILLVAGNKSGASESRFYRQLIARAEKRLEGHLKRLEQAERKDKSSHADHAKGQDAVLGSEATREGGGACCRADRRGNVAP